MVPSTGAQRGEASLVDRVVGCVLRAGVAPGRREVASRGLGQPQRLAGRAVRTLTRRSGSLGGDREVGIGVVVATRLRVGLGSRAHAVVGYDADPVGTAGGVRNGPGVEAIVVLPGTDDVPVLASIDRVLDVDGSRILLGVRRRVPGHVVNRACSPGLTAVG